MKVWWRRGNGTRPGPSYPGSTQHFRRMSLDSTSLLEVAAKMRELVGPDAELEVTGYSMAPLALDDIERWSPAHYAERVSLHAYNPKISDPAYMAADGVPQSLTISLLLNDEFGGAGLSDNPSLRVHAQTEPGPSTGPAMDIITRLIVALGRPEPTRAWPIWLVPAAATLLLVAPLVVASVRGQLPWLLWPATLLAVVFGLRHVFMWARARYRRTLAQRSILVYDKRPRHVVDEQRENDRRDVKQRVLGGAIGFVAGLATAVAVYFLGLK